jgi:hypothetical protein
VTAHMPIHCLDPLTSRCTLAASLLHPGHRYTTFRVAHLPDSPSLTVCINLRPKGMCPTLGDFCYAYNASGSCQYTLFNNDRDCCPTSMTTAVRPYGRL